MLLHLLQEYPQSAIQLCRRHRLLAAESASREWRYIFLYRRNKRIAHLESVVGVVRACWQGQVAIIIKLLGGYQVAPAAVAAAEDGCEHKRGREEQVDGEVDTNVLARLGVVLHRRGVRGL